MKRTAFLHLLAILALTPGDGHGQASAWTLVANTAGPGVSSRPVNAILPDPRAPDTLYVGTDIGILKVRASTGDTLAAGFGTRLGSQSIYAIAANPRNPSILYAGTSSDGLYRTVDGVTWTKMPGQLAAMNTIHAIAIDPRDTTLLYVGTGMPVSGIFRSTNSGASWSDLSRRDSVSTGGLPDSIRSVYFILTGSTDPDTVVFAGTLDNGIFRNRGGRAAWLPASSGLPTGPAARLRGLLRNPADGNVLYAGVAARGIYKSLDGGGTWTKKRVAASDTTDIQTLAQAPSSPTFLYGGTFSEAMFRSTVGAEIWDPLPSLPAGLSARAIAVHPLQPARIYSGTFNGVYQSSTAGVAQVTYGVGGGPTAVISANLDTSALADLAVSNGADNTVTILLNRGGGIFSRQEIAVGGNPRTVAVADVDGDGRPDLISANRIGQSLTVLRNNGFGGFSFAQDIFVGHALEGVAAADVDGDGDLDLVTANGDVNTVSVFLNSGRGTFFLVREQPVGVGPRSLAIADFNGDGRPDLAAACQAGNAVSILISRGAGLFATDVPLAIPGGPTALVAGDFNQDGAVDLGVLAGGRNALGLVGGNGDGSFKTPAWTFYGESPFALAAADLDADRYTDIVLAFHSTTLSLLNDGSGGFVAGSGLGSVAGIRGLALPDYDGDGRPDAALLSADARALVLVRNLLPVSVKRPTPPRNLRAYDTPADLGGRITLSWQQPRVDEETGRVTAYEIYRSSSRDGGYTRILSVDTATPYAGRDTVWVTRTTVDSTATVGLSFFYYSATRNASGAVSLPSSIATAVSTTQPFFSFDFSSAGLYSIGDTVTVRVLLNPLNYSLSGLSLFMDYAPRALVAVDSDPAKTGVQPIRLNPALLTSGVQVLENRLATDTPGKINLSLGSLTPIQNLPLDIGAIQFAAPRDTTAILTIVNDAASNRRTALISAADGSSFPPNLPSQPTSFVIRDYRVNGVARFQGRTANLALPVRIDVRQPGGLPLAVPYSPASDQDRYQEGIQLVLDGNGSFSLIQVPAGRFSLFLKAFHYLRGRVSGDSVTVGAGAPAGSLTFRWTSASGTVYNELRGGDANNDNNVNLTDFGLLARHFGTIGVTDSGNPAWVSDFNGDGKIDLADFSILSSNFGEQGFGQSLAPKPATSPARLDLARSADGEGDLIRIIAGGVGELSGFSVDLFFGSAAGEEFSAAFLTEGTAPRFQGVSFWWIVKPLDRGLRLAGYARAGKTVRVEDGEEIAILRLPGGAGEILPDLRTIRVEDGQGRLLQARGAMADGLPRQPALFQNLPNPFNPVTTIPYDVPEGASPGEMPAEMRVTLRIYSVTGQTIRTVVDDLQTPGRQRAIWDGRDDLGRPVASGVYFYRIRIGAFRDVKRMLLLR